MRPNSIRIIGIDPGLRRTGWGVVESDGVRLSYVASGLITSAAGEELAHRLRELFEGISSVIASLRPHEAAVEETFVNENARATLKKRRVAAPGPAENHNIKAMPAVLRPREKSGGGEGGAALAIAICHANH